MNNDEPIDWLRKSVRESEILVDHNRRKANYAIYDQAMPVIPIQEEYRLQVDQTLNTIQKILQPCLDNMEHQETIDELQQKMYLKLNPMFDRYNECNRKAFDLHSNFECSRNLVKELNTDGILFAKRFAREY